MSQLAGFMSLPGGTELFIILLVVILIFGPKNLPKLGSAMGRFISNLKAGQRGELEDEDEDSREPPPRSGRPSDEKNHTA